MRRVLAAGATALAAIALSGCDDGKHKAVANAVKDGIVATCAAGAKAVPLPSGFPTDLPMPPGTIVLKSEDRGSAGLVVTAISPRPFKEILAALQRDLPAKGFTLKHGETEAHDAESDWSSSGYEGRWAIRESGTCKGETNISFLARAKR